MKKVCTAREMRMYDNEALNIAGIPTIVLMENAAIMCVNAFYSTFPDCENLRVAVFVGKGNNGGDGFAIARHLHNKGIETVVYLTSGREFTGDALINYSIISRMGIKICDASEISEFELQYYDVIFDAILGTGISGEVYPEIAEVIDEINSCGKYVFSVDIPSGVNSDNGRICGACVKADETVTFAAYKRGMFLFPGADMCGKITVADISIPGFLLSEHNCNVTDAEFVRNLIGIRKRNTHKGNYGKVLIVGGSKGMTGAAYLSAQAALKAGAGLITLGICGSLNSAMEAKLTEVMTLPLSDNNGKIASNAADKIIEFSKNCDCILFGPGLGRGGEVKELLSVLLRNSHIPVVIDADGINALSEDKTILEQCSCSIILTPHTAEMSRLTGYDIEYIESNRFEVSAELSQELGATIILKGCHTIVTGSNDKQYINITGNPGMATGGSGDVLAGIVSAFLARGLAEEEASAAAVYIHGLAGDIASRYIGMESLTPTDIIEAISSAFNSILNKQ